MVLHIGAGSVDATVVLVMATGGVLGIPVVDVDVEGGADVIVVDVKRVVDDFDEGARKSIL